MASPVIMHPVHRLMACPPTCGAAAAILCSAEFARKHNLDASVFIAAQAMTTDTPATYESKDMIEVVGYSMAQEAARQVYEQAGVSPDDVDFIELHDCFAQNELISYEALGTEEGKGFAQMMEQLLYERTMVGVGAVAAMERAVEITTQYSKERKMFGKTLFDLQNTHFKLAECKTEAYIARVFIDNCIQQVIAGTLDAATAAMAKWWLTDKQFQIADECLQLHGGYGYCTEYPIAHIWADSRVQRIYGGANEVMKELVARTL